MKTAEFARIEKRFNRMLCSPQGDELHRLCLALEYGRKFSEKEAASITACCSREYVRRVGQLSADGGSIELPGGVSLVLPALRGGRKVKELTT